MKRPLGVCIALLGLMLFVAPAQADPIDFTVTLLPSSNISGTPGSTIGWGFTITNLSLTTWLEIFSVAADPFMHGTPDANIFSFPILAPNSSITVTFIPSVQGLYQLTWDPTAPVGFINAGVFQISGSFWNGDPFDPNSLIIGGLDLNVNYTATVTGPQTAVPEPASAMLLLSGIAALALIRRRASQSA